MSKLNFKRTRLGYSLITFSKSGKSIMYLSPDNFASFMQNIRFWVKYEIIFFDVTLSGFDGTPNRNLYY